MRRRGLWSAVVLAALALLLLESVPKSQAQQLIRGPYLQSGSSSSMTIVWRTSAAATGRVEYGTTLQYGQEQVVSTAKTQHEMALSGLSPDTTYYYRIGTTSAALAGGDQTYRFKTAPALGSKKKFRFWVVGDSGTGGSRQAEVRDAMLGLVGSAVPDIYLHLGDMAYNSGTTNEFTNNFFAPYEKILRNTVCWPTLGNHEGTSSKSGPQTGPYYEAYVLPKGGEAGGVASGTEAYYSFDYANAHFIVLDSHDSSRSPTGAMLTWLKSDLAATSQEWIIAFWHHPPYSKGTHNSDTEGQLVDMRENALPILEAGGADLILAGHSHIYERSYLVHGAYETPTKSAGKIVDQGDGRASGSGPYKKSPSKTPTEGTVYVVAGHGGTSVGQMGTHPLMFFVEKDHGSCIVDIQGLGLTLTNVRWDGQVTDTFTMYKGQGLVVTSPNGGETLAGGSTHPISWTTVGSVAQVILELSTNNGQSWSTIAGPIANTGSYTWTVPVVDSASAVIRIRDAADATRLDESNGPFKIVGSVPVDLITYGAVWKYHDAGLDLGSAWLASDYDDSGWKSGSGQLGYGESDEATKLDKPTPRYPSVYFRKTITLDQPVVSGDLKVLHDDGVVIWINGQQVSSKYADNGIAYDAFASKTSADNEESSAALDLSLTNPFRLGTNVVAVMVKQVSGTSSDLSFDLKLTLTLGTDAVPDAGMPQGDAGAPGNDAPNIGLDQASPTGDRALAGPDGSIGPTGPGGCGCVIPIDARESLWPGLIFFFGTIAASYRRRRRRCGARHSTLADRTLDPPL
jgi:hypothetical protein